MPEFILDNGTPEAARAFEALDRFTQGYIEAAFFTETGDRDGAENGLEHATFAELAPGALARMVADCQKFQYGENAVDFHNILPDEHSKAECEASMAGHDFWLTRNHHGAGFWDGDWPEPYATRLTDAACSFGECDLYRGDDGLIYLTCRENDEKEG